jgi:hypothetical protein|tara:strand:- start:278 stop:595 length:318 start_codon:yes stop_codon:yes gene_type:complete
MATLQHNLSTVLTTELLTAGDEINDIKNISIANVDLDSAIINLFLNKGDNNYYLIKGHRLTPGSTLFLNKDNNIAFDNSNDGFSLRTQVQDDSGAAVSVDVIITR